MISAEDSERYRMDMNNYNDYNNLKIQRGGSVVGQQSSFPSDRSTPSSSPLSHHSSDQQYRENYPQFSSQPQKPPFMMPMQQPQPQQQPFGNGRSGGGLNQQPQPQQQQQQTPPPFSSGSHPMYQSQNQSQPYMHDSYYSNHPMMNNTTPSANHHWNGTSSAHWDHPQSSYTYQDQTSSPPEQYQQQQQPPPQKVGGLFRSGGSGGSLNASPGTSFSSAQPMYSSSAQATQLPQTTTTTTNMNSWMGQQQQGTSVAGQQATPQMPPPTQPPSFQPPMMQGNSPQNGMLKNQPKPFSSQPSQQFPSMTGQNGGTPVALPPFEPMVQGNAMVQPQLQQESKGLVGSHAFNNLSIPTSQPSLLGGEQKLEELAAAYEKEIEQLKNYNAELRNMVDSEKNLIEKFKTIVEKVEQSNQYGSVMQSQMSQSSYPLENSFIQQGYPNINQGYSRYEQQQQIIYNQGNNYSSQGYQK